VQEVLQQTPLTQLPEKHWLLLVQVLPPVTSYRLAALCTAVPLMPPAIRTMLLPSTVAVWACTAAGMTVVAAQPAGPL
jgi:hypothetical protein